MKTKQQGFTLIELVVVIVLLGIVGAVATARFQDMSATAADAVEQGIAGELASASSINYAARTLDTATPKTIGSAVTGTSGTPADCDAIAASLLQSIPANVTFSTGEGDCADGVITCNVTRSGGTGTNASATVLCIN